jgi:hypothetical protein
MPPPLPNLLSCAIFASSILHDVASALASAGRGGGMTIVGLPGGQIQYLPDMYVRSMRRWIDATEDEDDNDDIMVLPSCANENDDAHRDGRGMGTIRMMAISGSGGVNNDDENDENDDENDDDDDGIAPRGWVNPTSMSELWWPLDVPTLQVRPSLDVLFRSGCPSYVSAGLDVRVPRRRRREGEDDDSHDGISSSSSSSQSRQSRQSSYTSWRNHGLNSQPIARQWTTLDIAMEKMFHVEGFLISNESSSIDGDGDGGGDRGDDEREQDRRELRKTPRRHETLFQSVDARYAMERMANYVAEMDASCPLAVGFHIASFPMTRGWIDLPRNYLGEGERDDDRDDIDDDGIGSFSSSSYGEEGGTRYKIVCLGTSEPFASKLLDMDDDIMAMSSTSLLEIDVIRTTKGGESMYLPEVYRELYLNHDGTN